MRLWLDRSAAFQKFSEIDELCRLAKRRGVGVVVPAQIYLEDRRQTRVRRGAAFSGRKFDAAYRQLVTVVSTPFDMTTAARWADRLAERYPEDAAWREAKRSTLGGKLFDVDPRLVPMTTDWWVSLAAEDEPSDMAVTRDGGEEWRFLRERGRVLTWEQAKVHLEGMEPIQGTE